LNLFVKILAQVLEYTENPEKRLWEHNNNFSRFTAGKEPWEIVYLKKYPTKTEALQAERKLKKAGSAYLQRLISAYKSEVG
jgi:putative endonuclease